MRGSIIKMRWMSFAFEKTPRISLSCELVPVQYAVYFENMGRLHAAVLAGTARPRSDGRYGPPSEILCFIHIWKMIRNQSGTRSIVSHTDVTEKTRKQNDLNLQVQLKIKAIQRSSDFRSKNRNRTTVQRWQIKLNNLGRDIILVIFLVLCFGKPYTF